MWGKSIWWPKELGTAHSLGCLGRQSLTKLQLARNAGQQSAFTSKTNSCHWLWTKAVHNKEGACLPSLPRRVRMTVSAYPKSFHGPLLGVIIQVLVLRVASGMDSAGQAVAEELGAHVMDSGPLPRSPTHCGCVLMF